MDILLNASNLHSGGGVAVASSAIAEFATMTGKAERLTVLASTEVTRNLHALDCRTSAFRSFRQYDVHGVKAVLRQWPVRVKDFRAVLTIFGPLYIPTHGVTSVMGFAQPWVAYPENSASSLLPRRQRLKTRAKYSLVALAFGSADTLIVEHAHVRDSLKRRRLFADKRIMVVSNTVDSVHFDPERWRHLELPPRTPGVLRLGVVARNYAHKNLQVLPAVKRVLRSSYGIESEIYVTLTEEEYASCSGDFRDNTKTVGELQLAETPSFNAQMDAIVFPSLLECFSATPLEALAAGTPLFASDRDFVRKTTEGHARYFDPLSPNSIAKVIYDYFSLPEQTRGEFQSSGQRFVSSGISSARERALLMLEAVESSVPSQGKDRQ